MDNLNLELRKEVGRISKSKNFKKVPKRDFPLCISPSIIVQREFPVLVNHYLHITIMPEGGSEQLLGSVDLSSSIIFAVSYPISE